MKLSREQNQAITTIDNNVCVNAGAGSGKTEVLTRRFVEIIQTKKVPLDSVVCITFTKKASFEMKERIRHLLEEENIHKNADILNVSTIHSFCKDTINRYTLPLDLDPDFSVMEEDEKARQIQHQFYRYLHDDTYRPLYDALMEKLELKDFSALESFLKAFYELFETYNTSPEKVDANLKERIKAIPVFQKENLLMDLMEECLEHLGSKEPLRKYLQKFESDIRTRKISLTNEFLIPIVEDTGTAKKTRELRDELKTVAGEKLAEKEKTYLPLYEELFRYIRKFREEFRQYKKEHGVVDFNDLENLMDHLLDNREIRKEVQNSVSYLMVDEFQDTSDLQKKIFQKLTSVDSLYDRKNLFVVGDPKQAIYGFRGANIEIFDQTKEEILDSGGVSIVFQENFRSQKNIMDMVNVVYAQRIPSYDPLTAIKEAQGPVEVIPGEKNSNFVQEAEIFSENIETQELDDFVALFRTRSKFQELEEILKEKKIPFYSFGTTGFSKCYEVQDFCCFVEYFLTREETALIGILQNYYEMSPEELYAWKSTRDFAEHPAFNDLTTFIEKLKKEFYHMDLASFVWKVFEKYELMKRYNTFRKDDQAQANLYQIFECAVTCDEENFNLQDFYRILSDGRMEEQKQVETQDSKTLKLMTIHAAKGLGFHNVYVPAIGTKIKSDTRKFRYLKGQFALKFQDTGVAFQKLNEEKLILEEKEADNLYYTAMTRAKNRLILGITGRKEGYKKYIDDILTQQIENGTLQILENRESTYSKEEASLSYTDFRCENRPSDLLRRSISVTKFSKEQMETKEFDREKKQTAKMTPKIGLIIHKFAEIYHGDKQEALQQAMMYYNEDIEMKFQYEKYADAFLRFNSNSSGEVLKEVPFFAKIKGQVFSGIIDRIEKEEHTIKVIDFKLSNKTKDDLYNTYALQLAFYGYVLEQKYGGNIELELQNLQREEKVTILYEEVKQELLEHFNRFFDGRIK